MIGAAAASRPLIGPPPGRGGMESYAYVEPGERGAERVKSLEASMSVI